MLEQGKDSSPRAAAKTTCDELTIHSISCPPMALGEAVKEGQVRRKSCFLMFFFTSPYPVLILLVINSINISSFEPALPMMAFGE